MMKSVLYLASQSSSRKSLLQQAKINFKTIDHTSDEVIDTQGLDFFNQVLAIAEHKMMHVILPAASQKDEEIFVLTADSLVRLIATQEIFGKPKDLEHAKYMLRSMYEKNIEVATGCCLEKRRWNGYSWELIASERWTTSALVEYWVPEEELDSYFRNHPEAFYSAGAGIIEGQGQIYFKSLQGSYSAALGLPLFELKNALKSIHFLF